MNTAEIISKVTMRLPLINSNKDFDFVGRVIKTPCLFYFRSVKFHYVKEALHINSLLTLVKFVLASQHESQDLLTIENTDLDLKVHAKHYHRQMSYSYASDIIKNFCKLAKQAEVIRNSAKKGFCL